MVASEAHYEQLSTMIGQYLPKDKFTLVRRVPVFCEHETVDSKGEKQKYGRDQLQSIVDRNNERVAKKSLAPLIDGHTPEAYEVIQGAKQPDVLGYIGPYVVDELEPGKWGIFQDEWWLNDHVGQRIKKAGRSIEMPLFPDMNKRFFSSVAALSTTSPALPLPMKFSESIEGIEVARYSAFPSGSNCYSPSTDIRSSKARYETMSPEEMVNAIVQGVVAAIQGAAGGGGAAPAGAGAGAPPAGGGTDKLSAASNIGALSASRKLDADKDAEEAKKKKDQEEKDKAKTGDAKYDALLDTIGELRVEIGKYGRLEADQKIIMEERSEAIRLAKVAKLQASGYLLRDEKVTVDGKEVIVPGDVYLVKTTKYMTDEQFADQLVFIAKYGTKVTQEPRLFVPPGREHGITQVTSEGGQEGVEKARYDACVDARKQVEAARLEGKPTKGMYEQIRDRLYTDRKIAG